MTEENANSSVSQGPMIYKILIDLAEYRTLLRSHELYENWRTERGEQMKIGERAGEKKIKSKEFFTHPLASPQIQVGGGDRDHSSDSIKQVQNCLPNVSNEREQTITGRLEQHGCGDDNDLAPPAQEFNYVSQDPVYDAALGRNNSAILSHSENILDRHGNNKLLQSVSAKFQPLAKQLIEELRHHRKYVFWTAKGNLFIKKKKVSDANIKNLFPQLWKHNKTKFNLPGYVQLASALMSLGLGKLIFYRKYMNRQKGWTHKPSDLSSKLPYYYIGEKD